MNVKIIVDSTCDLPRDLFEELNIGVVTLYVLLDEVSYREWQEITPEEVVAWSNKTNKPPTTSAPSVDDFLKEFEPCAKKKQDIVFIGTSAETTATCQVGQIAADMVKGIKIEIIDGRSISGGTACIAYKAAKLAQSGASHEEVVAAVKDIIPRVFTSFVPETLEFLRRSGRASVVKAMAASSLKLKPEITAKDGFLVQGEMFRGPTAKVAAKYIDKRLENLGGIDPEVAFVASTPDEKELRQSLYEKVVAKNYFENVYSVRASCVVSAHAGPNTYSISYIKKKND